MGDNSFSIVITTYNRKKELLRCLKSIFDQEYATKIEIIIVDDCSPINYEQDIKVLYEGIKFIRNKENSGPGVGRNIGIKEATNDFVVIMDDDDIFSKDAFVKISSMIKSQEIKKYPVVSFLISNAKAFYDEQFYVYSFSDLLNNKISGDLCQVINRELWLKNNYEFPSAKIGAELLLWFKVAIDYGYPVVNEVIVQLFNDADGRLTDFSYQITRAELFAQYQVDIINNFKDEILRTNNEQYLVSKYKGAVTYYLLAGNKEKAKVFLKELNKYDKKSGIIFNWLLKLHPKIIQKIFLIYRKWREYFKYKYGNDKHK